MSPVMYFLKLTNAVQVFSQVVMCQTWQLTVSSEMLNANSVLAKNPAHQLHFCFLLQPASCRWKVKRTRFSETSQCGFQQQLAASMSSAPDSRYKGQCDKYEANRCQHDVHLTADSSCCSPPTVPPLRCPSAPRIRTQLPPPAEKNSDTSRRVYTGAVLLFTFFLHDPQNPPIPEGSLVTLRRYVSQRYSQTGFTQEYARLVFAILMPSR